MKIILQERKSTKSFRVLLMNAKGSMWQVIVFPESEKQSAKGYARNLAEFLGIQMIETKSYD